VINTFAFVSKICVNNCVLHGKRRKYVPIFGMYDLLNNPCRESVVHLSNICDTGTVYKVTNIFTNIPSSLRRRRGRVPGRNENRSTARHPRYCDVQYRGSDST